MAISIEIDDEGRLKLIPPGSSPRAPGTDAGPPAFAQATTAALRAGATDAGNPHVDMTHPLAPRPPTPSPIAIETHDGGPAPSFG